MIKRFILTAGIATFSLISAVFGALPEVPSDQAGAALWKAKREATIADLQTKANEEKIPALSEILRQLKSLGYRNCPERDSIVAQLENTLLAIPGHAKYYQDQIERTRDFVKRYEALPEEEKRRVEDELRQRGGIVSRWYNYDGVRRDAFDILALLPSPETVAVLGHFLEDPEGRDGLDLLGDPIHNGSDSLPSLPNCGQAYFALAKLGIENAPTPPGESEGSVLKQERADAWKQWWEEIKSGKRTYRFKGSATEYGPDGPATREQLARVERALKRGAAGRKAPATAPVSPDGRESATGGTTIALVLAGLVVLGSLAWYFRKAKPAG